MTISDARAGLAEVIDEVRVGREPVYLTRRGRAVAAIVDLAYLEALQTGQWRGPAVSRNLGEHRRRLDYMTTGTRAFASLFDPGRGYPDSASDLYASREVAL